MGLFDFDAYLQVHQRHDHRWVDQRGTSYSPLMNTARRGFFSSDRSIQDYEERIWNGDPIPVELTCSSPEQTPRQPFSGG